MKGFLKVDKNTDYSIWVNISHIVYLYDGRIILSNGETKIVKESASEMLSDIEAMEEEKNNE